LMALCSDRSISEIAWCTSFKLYLLRDWQYEFNHGKNSVQNEE
jgi:hypothetical protein